MDRILNMMERTPSVLLVEDEETVSSFIRRVLEADGFHVLSAQSSVEALQIGASFRGTIDLLLSDVRMRLFQNGLELADCFGLLRPGTAVLLTSGSCLPGCSGARERGWGFLPKPFASEQLLAAVRELVAPVPASRDWVFEPGAI